VGHGASAADMALVNVQGRNVLQGVLLSVHILADRAGIIMPAAV